MKKNKAINQTVQFALPVLTFCAQMAVSLKLPQWGLLINIIAQPFWLYSSWKSYKQAGQIGLFISASIYTIVIMFGIVNYWFL